jgi:hypothetical protein
MLCISRAVRGDVLRDEPLGAKPKARLRALPGFATKGIARKTAPRRVRPKTGALPTKPLARSYGYVTRGVGEQFIPFLTRTRMAGLMQSIPRPG